LTAWLALSAAACLLNATTSREHRSTGAGDESLWKKTSGAQGMARIAASPSALPWTIQVKGKVTGRPYVFSVEAREKDVDPHDARGFLQESIFVVAKKSILRHW
jgi:hypothetical protein